MDKDKRSRCFDEVESGFSAEEGFLEASRCLQCNYNIFIDADKCILCGGCIDECPHDCINMVSLDKISSGDLPELMEAKSWESGVAMVLNEENCIRCASCEKRCPTGAITMKKYDLMEVRY